MDDERWTRRRGGRGSRTYSGGSAPGVCEIKAIRGSSVFPGRSHGDGFWRVCARAPSNTSVGVGRRRGLLRPCTRARACDANLGVLNASSRRPLSAERECLGGGEGRGAAACVRLEPAAGYVRVGFESSPAAAGASTIARLCGVPHAPRVCAFVGRVRSLRTALARRVLPCSAWGGGDVGTGAHAANDVSSPPSPLTPSPSIPQAVRVRTEEGARRERGRRAAGVH
ncbi:hypothetical protein BC628DRAFT_271679 [Trametes gibbosa]|nr:hypothetical protein BC628DRAFT_271679 [Trametes gibbosa]